MADRRIATGFPSVQDLFTTTPLYLSLDLNQLTKTDILKLQYFHGTVDAYCIECKGWSVFHAVTSMLPIGTPRDTSVRASRARLIEHANEASAYADRMFDIVLRCARVPAHRIWLAFAVRARRLIKIGQYPSLADLQLPELDKYDRVLTKEERAEFGTAIGLKAHGVGIGAFVYLRRIFESLIEKAHAKARGEPGWDERDFQERRVNEKIIKLKDYLPESLVENASIYSILSKGIHSLSEDECLRHFDPLKLGIELILDQEIERRNREAKARTMRSDIQKLQSHLKKR